MPCAHCHLHQEELVEKLTAEVAQLNMTNTTLIGNATQLIADNRRWVDGQQPPPQ
jgi:hypothetical protein